eukprot:TRINITY_DN29089_c0_g2_i2.p2 TRINITY_DN29089_c0_g2~~TRINITY_DN29089_c0_g2_i2.p2  ORF type:complete len:104 (+),score=7.61 TRINITY_DN29089_c0_g2_i2:133-444(+)
MLPEGTGGGMAMLLGRQGGIYASFFERSLPYFAEFLGTFFLAMCFLCNLNTQSAWAISARALMMIGLMSAFGHISGANLNPSVSISLWIFLKCIVMGIDYCNY